MPVDESTQPAADPRQARVGAAGRHLPPVIITIDGPAGTGKSSVAHLLARRLGLEFLDTGAMYRAAALIAIEQGIDPRLGEDLADGVREADLHFDWRADPPRLFVGMRDISQRIRDLDVSAIVSIVAAQPPLRRVLVEQQRRIADRHPRLVSEGRDQGSVVFPDASVRFYLHADVNVRARRRMEQLAAAGKTVDMGQIARDILARDQLDAGRADAPLIRPQGAVDIDTGDHTLEEVVARLETIVRDRLPQTALLAPAVPAAKRAAGPDRPSRPEKAS
jgi:cytidylate kinase